MNVLKLVIVLVFIVILVSYCESNDKDKQLPVLKKGEEYIVIDCFDLKKNLKSRPTSHDINLQNPGVVDRIAKENLEITEYSRHHVIPYIVLSKFFNNVFYLNKQVQTNACVQIFYIMTIIMDMVSFNTKYEYIYIDDVQNNIVLKLMSANEKTITELLENPKNVTVVSKHIHKFFVWFPGNIFIGPTLRSDDPGDGLETFSKYVIGQNRYNILLSIYDSMMLFNNNHKKQTKELNYAQIKGIVVNFKKLIDYTIVPFNKINWEQEGGKWKIKHAFLDSYPKNEKYDVKDNELTLLRWKDETPKIRKTRDLQTRRCTYEGIARQIKEWYPCAPKNSNCTCF